MKKFKILFLILLLSMFIYIPEVNAMQIFAEKITGENIKIEVESSDTIEAVKEKIYQIDNTYLTEFQKLIFDGKEMEDGRTLADYNVQKEDTIQLLLENTTFEVKYNLINLNVITNNVTIDGNIGNNTYIVSKKDNFSAKLESVPGYDLPKLINIKTEDALLDITKYSYNSETGEILINKENLTGNINIQASAIKINYKVTFDANGGLFKDNTETLIIEKWENEISETLDTPIKDGYKFKGYYTEKTGGIKFEMILNESGIDSNMTFYAQWEENSIVAPSVSEDIKNPKTGDNIIISINMLIISFIGLLVALKIIKK